MPAVLVDGQATNQVSAWDRGFQYGDGIFETIAVIQGKPLFWPSHFARLSRCASLLALPGIPEADWLADMRTLVRPELSRQVIKLVLTRGVGGRGYGISGRETGTRVVYAMDWPDYPASHWRAGIHVALCQTPLLGGAPFASCKTLNRLNQVVARHELQAINPDLTEGLMLDSTGMVREGTFTNVFWVRDGRVETPKLDQAGIGGIMRKEIITWLASQEIPVYEVDAPAAILAEASECFVSNSLIGIWPVGMVEDMRNLPQDRPVANLILSWLESLALVSKAQ